MIDHEKLSAVLIELGEHLESRFSRLEWRTWVLAIALVLTHQYSRWKVEKLSDRLDAVEVCR